MKVNTTYIAILCVLVLVVAGFAWAYSSPTKTAATGDTTIEDYFKPGVDHDTIYFRVVDANGLKSFIHDSGVKPSELEASGATSFDLNIVKGEYNEGDFQSLGLPKTIMYGRQITNLNYSYTVPPDRVKDNGLCYVVTVTTDGNRLSSN